MRYVLLLLALLLLTSYDAHKTYLTNAAIQAQDSTIPSARPIPEIDTLVVQDVEPTFEISEITEIASISDFFGHKPAAYDEYAMITDVNVGPYNEATIIADIMPGLPRDTGFLSLFFYVFSNTGDMLSQMEYRINGLSFSTAVSLMAYDVNKDGLNDLVFTAYGVGGNSVLERYYGDVYLAGSDGFYLEEALRYEWGYIENGEKAADILDVIQHAEEYFCATAPSLTANDPDTPEFENARHIDVLCN